MFDFSGSHFKNGRQSPHTTRVNISASNPPKIEIFLFKYTFSRVLIKNKVFVNTLIQQNNKNFMTLVVAILQNGRPNLSTYQYLSF